MIIRHRHRLLALAVVAATLVACLDLPVAPEAVETAAAARCTPDDAFEENDSPETASIVSLGTLRAVTCRTDSDTAEDRDFYALRGTPDSGYRTWLAAAGAALAELRLFDAATGEAVARQVDGNLLMPRSGRLLASVRLCCVKPGDSLPYTLLLSDRPNHAPVPAFDVSPARPVVGKTATLTSRATDVDGDSLPTRRWTLGDGRTASGAVVTTSWPLRGTYRVTHVVTDQWGRADSLSQDVSVDPDVARIDVTPAASELVSLGDSLPLAAVARDPAGNAVSDVAFAWSSSDTAVATVSATGVVVARANGVAQMGAAAYGRTGSATVTVRQRVARVVVTPAALRFGALGRTVTLAARAEDARGKLVAGTAVAWSSLDSAVASVSAAGVVTARRAGSTSVRAAAGSVTATVPVVVAPVVTVIDVTPTSESITAATDSVLLTAVPRDSSGAPVLDAVLTWTSDATLVATVRGDGWVFPVGNGTATISASVGAVRGQATITVALAPGGSPPGAPFAVIASPDTAFIPAPWTTEPILRARVVDAAGVTVPGQTFTWSIITPAFSYGLSTVGAATNDSVKVTLPYCCNSGRKLFKVQVTSGAFADTLIVFQVGPRVWDNIAAGRAHTCGLTYGDYSSGIPEVYCWGDNSRGQLGLPSTVADSPVPVRMPSDTFNVSALSAGDDFTCARGLGSKAYCWGANQFGQLGAVSADDCGGLGCSREAIQVVGVSAARISAGPEHVCSSIPQVFFGGFGTAPEVWCWGRNQHGQLGRDPLSTAWSSTPALLGAMPVLGGINGVAAFGGTSCHVISGVRRCFGLNSSGEYGMNTTVGSFVVTNSPVPPPTLTDDFINGGVGFLCGFPRPNTDLTYGKISCWGSDASGQLGLAAGYTRQSCGGAPCVINATVSPFPQPQYGAAAINGASHWWDVGAAHVCAQANPDFTCWGDNAGGQLGDGTRISRSVPTIVTLPAGAINQVSAGVAHTCVDISGAGLYCWGTGASGRLGDNARTDRLTPVRVVDP